VSLSDPRRSGGVEPDAPQPMPPADWYLEESTGLMRFWDGRAWTTRRRAIPTPQTTTSAAQPVGIEASLPSPAAAVRSSPRTSARKRPRVRFRVLVATVVCLFLGYGAIRTRSDEFRVRCALYKAGIGNQGFLDDVFCAVFYR
jgi:Protein of unknown function (DUF2510)